VVNWTGNSSDYKTTMIRADVEESSNILYGTGGEPRSANSKEDRGERKEDFDNPCWSAGLLLGEMTNYGGCGGGSSGYGELLLLGGIGN